MNKNNHLKINDNNIFNNKLKKFKFNLLKNYKSNGIFKQNLSLINLCNNEKSFFNKTCFKKKYSEEDLFNSRNHLKIIKSNSLLNSQNKIPIIHYKNNSDGLLNKKIIKIKNVFHSQNLIREKIKNNSKNLSLNKNNDYSFKNNEKQKMKKSNSLINLENRKLNQLKIYKNINNFLRFKKDNQIFNDFKTPKNSFLFINNTIEKNNLLDSRNKKIINHKSLNSIKTINQYNKNFKIKEIRVFHSIDKNNNLKINDNSIYNNKFKINKIKFTLLKNFHSNGIIKKNLSLINLCNNEKSFLNKTNFKKKFSEEDLLNSRNHQKIKSNSILNSQNKISENNFISNQIKNSIKN